MRTGLKLLLIASVALAGAACGKKDQPPQDQNIVIDDGNLPANADIEALPPDESSETATNELDSGTDNPDVNDLNASSNSY